MKEILTSFTASIPVGAWAGLALEKPSRVKTITFMPPTTGNHIEIGDLYELVYWDRDWVSLGRQTATTDSLIFDDVPTDALYLLHNLTNGKEERIFTYEEGKQVWWGAIRMEIPDETYLISDKTHEIRNDRFFHCDLSIYY